MMNPRIPAERKDLKFTMLPVFEVLYLCYASKFGSYMGGCHQNPKIIRTHGQQESSSCGDHSRCCCSDAARQVERKAV